MGAELPAGFHNPVAPGAVTFQAMAAFWTAQKGLFHFAAAPRALFFSVASPAQEKDDNRAGQQEEHRKQENRTRKKGAGAAKPAAMTKI